MFVRTIWNCQVYREITEVIEQCKPDVVHCHNTFPLISPSVYWAAARQGVPVVQTLHNYRLVCINPYLYRNGRICEDCLGRSPLRGVIHRCYRGSFAASFTVAAMLMIHRILGTYRNKVTTYIALTEFGRKKFLEARLCDPSMVVVKPNAVAASAPTAQVLGTRYQVLANTASTKDGIATKNHEKPQKAPSSHTEAQRHREHPDGSDSRPFESIRGSDPSRDAHSQISNFKFQISTPPTVLYVGRLSPEKGPHLLIEAWRLLALKNPEIVSRHRLVIAGGGPEQHALEEKAKALPSIDFTGHLSQAVLHEHMTAACVLVLPSTCYETFAMAVNEAASLGTPAIVSDIGGQASIVQEGATGFTFRSGSAESLAEALAKALADPDRLAEMGRDAQARFLASDCPPERNVAALSATYGHSVAVRRCQSPPACGH